MFPQVAVIISKNKLLKLERCVAHVNDTRCSNHIKEQTTETPFIAFVVCCFGSCSNHIKEQTTETVERIRLSQDETCCSNHIKEQTTETWHPVFHQY